MKLIQTTLLATTFGVIFSTLGCTDTASNKTNPVTKPEEKLDLDDYVSPLPSSAPTIKVATEAHYAPFVSRDDVGGIKGLDVDLMRAIGETQGFKVEFFSMSWPEVYPSVERGDYDVALSGTPIEAEVLKKLNASNPYLYDHLQMVSLADKPVNSVAELAGKRIGAQQGTSLVDVVNSIENSTLVGKHTVYHLFEDIVRDESDVFLAAESASLYISKEFPEREINFANFDEENIKLGFYVNKDKKELLEQINNGIDAIKESGRYSEINKKWFGDDAEKLMIK